MGGNRDGCVGRNASFIFLRYFRDMGFPWVCTACRLLCIFVIRFPWVYTACRLFVYFRDEFSMGLLTGCN